MREFPPGEKLATEAGVVTVTDAIDDPAASTQSPSFDSPVEHEMLLLTIDLYSGFHLRSAYPVGGCAAPLAGSYRQD
jgi:hypothetical protein